MSAVDPQRWLAVLVALVALVAGCAPERRTQVMIVLSADASIESMSERVRVRVITNAGQPSEQMRLEEVGTSSTPVRFPLHIALVPQDRDASRVFRVELTALDAGGRELVGTSVVSGFVRHRTMRLDLALRECCRGVVCDASQTCRANPAGECGCVAPEIEPSSLPDYPSDAGPLDAAAPPDAPACAGDCFEIDPFVGGISISPWPRDRMWAAPLGGCPATGLTPTADHGYASFFLHNARPGPQTIQLTTQRFSSDPSIDLALVVYDVPGTTGVPAALPDDPLACRAYSDDAPGIAPDARIELTVAPGAYLLVVITRETPGTTIVPDISVAVQPLP